MANQKISTYLTEVLALIPNDRLDISKEISPGVFDTQFLKYSTLLTELNGDLTVDNLYTADDDLTGNRTVGLLANELTFASTGDANLLKLETTNDRIGIGTATPAQKLHVVGSQYITTSLGVAVSTPAEALDVLGKQLLQDTDNHLYLRHSAVASIFIGRIAGQTTGTVANKAVHIGDGISNAALNIGDGSVRLGYGNASTANDSIAIGTNANATTNNSIAIGVNAQNTTGTKANNNISLGYFTNQGTTNIGSTSLAVGYLCDSIGNDSAAVGSSAVSNSNGSNSFGREAEATGINSLSLGSYTAPNADRAVVIGSGINSAGKLANIIANSVAIGANSDTPTMWVTGGTGIAGTSGNVGIGTSTPTEKLEVAGNIKLSLTSNSIYSGSDKWIHRTGHDNNVYVGKQTGLVTTGVNNVGIGSTVLNDLLGGGSNVGLGNNAAALITTGNDNVAIGANTLLALNGAKQTSNTVIGKSALGALISGNYNCSLGASSGQTITGGDYNVFLGYATGYDVAGTFDKSVILGYNTKATASNQFVVGTSGGGGQLDDWFIGRGVDQAALSGGGISFEMSVTSIEAGVTDISSEYDWNFNASRGTGTGDGGHFSFKTAPVGATGSTQNALIEAIRIDANATAAETRFMIYDVDNATLERVSVGVADSGGVGFKLLRIPN